AAGTDRPGFAREGDEAFEPTRVAPHPGEAPPELAAAQEFAELALDEARQAGAVADGGRLRQEAVEMTADHVMKDRVGCHPRRVGPWQHAWAQRRPCRGRSRGPSGRRSCLA